MNITSTVDGSTTTLALDGWLDTLTSADLAQAINDLDPSCEKLILDFASLEYISSAGLRQIVTAFKLMKGNLTLRNVSAEVMQVLHLAGIDKRVNII